jgi:YjbR protein
MMSAKDFRRIVLAMKDTLESAHMGHPDFRVNGRIFATLHPDLLSGMVKLTPDQQLDFVRENPAAFMPEAGAWGRQGCTKVRLDSVDEDTLGEAITLAWQNAVRKGVTGLSKPKRTTRSMRSSHKH